MSKSDDLKMLDTLLEYDTLDGWEKEAFLNMRDRLAKSDKALTKTQRGKIEQAWNRLGLDSEKGAHNLWSSGKIPMGKPIRLPYEDMPKPLKPPGKS